MRLGIGAGVARIDVHAVLQESSSVGGCRLIACTFIKHPLNNEHALGPILPKSSLPFKTLFALGNH